MPEHGSLRSTTTVSEPDRATDPTATTHLSVLGPMLVAGPDGEVRPRAGRQRRLLSILAVHALRGRPASIDELVTGVYGFDLSAPSKRSLATELWRARQVLGSAAIVTDADGYRLDPDHCRVDALEFEILLRHGRSALRAGDAADAERSLRSALTLWRGEPLTDWRDRAEGVAAAERLRELYTGGRVDHADALAALGRHEESVLLLEQVTEATPTNEHAWALLVEHDLALGRHRAAREAFDTARRTLAEYGVDVGAELDAARRAVGAAPVRQTPTAGRPTSALLVGRETETARLEQTVRSALDRTRFGLALITGEAGIGKTALVEHLVGQLATGSGPAPTVVVAHCDRRTVLPYGPLAPVLRSLGASGDVLGPIMTPSPGDPSATLGGSAASSRTVLHEAIAVAVESAVPDSGLVLVVEDVHWAPPDTLEALDTLVARRSSLPFTMVLTARDPAPLDADVAGPLGELRRRSDLAVDLRGLDLAGTAALIGADRTPEDVSRLHRVTGGHPLYLTHLRGMDPADLGRRVPTLDAAVDDHLAAVSDLAGRVLRLAAVVGTQIDLRVLTAAGARVSPPFSPVDVAEAVEESLAAGLLRHGSDHSVSWVHEVVCTRLYAAIPAHVRIALHVGVAEASERLVTGAPVALDLIAHHYAAGWPHCSTALAVSRLADAGDRAVGQLGFVTAARYFRQATGLIGMDPDFDDVELTADLLEAEALSTLAAAGLPGAINAEDDLVRARALFGALGALADRGSGTARLRSALGLARTSLGHRIDETVLDDLATGVAELLDDPHLASAVPLLDAGLVQLASQRPVQADELLDRALTAQPDSSGRLRVSTWARQGVADRLVTAHELVRDPSADPLAAWTRLWVSEATAGRRALDDPPPGRPEASGSDDHSRWEAEAWAVTTAIAGGHYTRAERLLGLAGRRVAAGRSALEIANRASAAAGQALRLRVLRSRSPLVADGPIPEGSFTNSHPLISHPVIGAWAAYMAAVTGRPDDAYRSCDDLIEQYLDGVVPEADVLAWACGTATAALITGHRRASEFLRGVLEPHSGHIAVLTFTAYWGGVDHFLGRLALAAGDLDEAVDRLDAAVLQYRLTRARAYEGRALLHLANARWRVGGRSREDARSHHHDAVTLLDTLDPPGPDDAPWPAPDAPL